MRFRFSVCLLVWLSIVATAQVLPTSTGSCAVSASGLEDCDWTAAMALHRGDPNKSAGAAKDERSQVFVTRFILSPAASFRAPVAGHDNFIVGMSDGELVNEAKSPPTHTYVSNGSVILMPKEEPYLLRNVGKQRLDLLLIEHRKVVR